MEKDKAYGALIGLAVGDALGTTLEFTTRGTFEKIDDIIGGGPFNLRAGDWTDDTSMALCLADSLAYCKKMNLKDQMNRYCNWRSHGYLSSNGRCFDIGITTSRALSNFERTGEVYSGPTDEKSSGNGSIMRLAPVPIFYRKSLKDTSKYSKLSSRTTHGSKLCIDSCNFMGILLTQAINNKSKEELCSPLVGLDSETFEELLADSSPQVMDIINGSYKTKSEEEISSSGFVISTLEAALWAFYTTNNFKEGALKAVNLGRDADTVGAVYGQIAGAFYGFGGIPSPWVKKLTKLDTIVTLFERIF